jgi:hypothetical protein
MKRKLPYVLLIAALVAIGSLGFYGWKLTNENKTLRKDLTYTKTKAEMLQKKFVEQKKMAEELIRLKSNLEGQQRNSQAEIEKEKQVITAENAAMKAQAAELKKKLDALAAERDGERKELTNLKGVHQKTVQDLDKLSDSKKTVEAKLKKTEEQLDVSRTKNAELCRIAGELMDKYKNKGVIGAVTQKEPLTQIKKVKLEQMTQEYSDKIKELKIENKNPG